MLQKTTTFGNILTEKKHKMSEPRTIQERLLNITNCNELTSQYSLHLTNIGVEVFLHIKHLDASKLRTIIKNNEQLFMVEYFPIQVLTPDGVEFIFNVNSTNRSILDLKQIVEKHNGTVPSMQNMIIERHPPLRTEQDVDRETDTNNDTATDFQNEEEGDTFVAIEGLNHVKLMPGDRVFIEFIPIFSEYNIGDDVSVLDIFRNKYKEETQWRTAKVINTTRSLVRIHFTGWNEKHDITLDLHNKRDQRRISKHSILKSHQRYIPRFIREADNGEWKMGSAITDFETNQLTDKQIYEQCV